MGLLYLVEAVAKAMGRVYQEAGVDYHVYCLKADSQGAKIID